MKIKARNALLTMFVLFVLVVACGPSPEQIASMVPMKRAGRPEEVAAVVGFLASDEAGYVSGQIIGVNGGMI